MLRSLLLTAALAFVSVPASAAPQGYRDVDIVVWWYRHYLGREPDQEGLNEWIGHLRRGMPVREAESHFLSSPEYYERNGATPRGFVRGMYRDILGRYPSHQELSGQVTALYNAGGDRQAFAFHFLADAQLELQQRPAPALAPPPRRVPPPIPPEEYIPRMPPDRR